MQIKIFRGMNYRRLGRSGLWVSEVGLGLWKWGDPTYDGSRVGEHAGFEILDRALELGVTHWDTANSYNAGSGNSERLLGRYFASRGSRARDLVVLATKVRNGVRDEHELGRTFGPNETGASRKVLLQAVEDCLRRLQTDRIDLLYHHSPALLPDGSWETPLEETWDALNTLVSQGKVLYLGVSNRTRAQLAVESAALAQVAGQAARRIVAVQNGYNLMQRGGASGHREGAGPAEEARMLAYLAQEGIGLVPYVPLAVGLLTGRYRRGQIDPSGRLSDPADAGWAERYLTDENLERIEQLIAIAQRLGCTLAQLAIAWLLSHESVPTVIAGVTRLEHLEENAGAPAVSLDAETLAEIDRLTAAA
ncbi:MAG: aldo/keto reductase [Anaerolineae bacterium]|nr:aldo/keto reductase [Anaerolineae bacterium]